MNADPHLLKTQSIQQCHISSCECTLSLVEVIPSRTIILGQPGIDGKLCCQKLAFQVSVCWIIVFFIPQQERIELNRLFQKYVPCLIDMIVEGIVNGRHGERLKTIVPQTDLNMVRNRDKGWKSLSKKRNGTMERVKTSQRMHRSRVGAERSVC